MNTRISTLLYYCFAVIIVYLVFITLFNTAEHFNPVGSGESGETKERKIQNSTQEHDALPEDKNWKETATQPLSSCSETENVVFRNVTPSTVYQNFYSCASPLWERFQGSSYQILPIWAYSSSVCDQKVDIPLIPYRTKDKTYWGIPPQCQSQHTLVTLGIRYDHLAIRKMRKSWGKPLVAYGTSAFQWRNADYDRFYNYAIGVNGTGIQTIYDEQDGRILELKNTSVKAFFQKVLELKIIDMLWINLEGGEFEYWKYFGKNGEFTEMGITVCQMNLEFDNYDAKHFETFMTEMLTSKWYISMRPTAIRKERITRAFFLNVNDPICVGKYLKL